MGKLESNKQQKRTSLLDTAFKLFTTQGVSKTSIAEISQKAGIAKGTFYLYFKDKYDIRNKLISHEASKLFKNAVGALNEYIDTETSNNPDFNITFTEQIIFIADHVINALNNNQTLLTFISKNLSWGIFKEALTTNVADDDINFKHIYFDMLSESGLNLKEPEIMLFMIVELISSTCYSAILYREPADIDTLKPYLYNTIRAIINEHINGGIATGNITNNNTNNTINNLADNSNVNNNPINYSIDRLHVDNDFNSNDNTY